MMRSVWVSMMSNPFGAMAPAWASPQYLPCPDAHYPGRSHRPCQPPQRVVMCGTLFLFAQANAKHQSRERHSGLCVDEPCAPW
jgi:hypothetical protein